MLFEILAQATVTPTSTPSGGTDIFRDGIWEFIGVVAGIVVFFVGIGFTLWMSHRDRKAARKEREQAEKEREQAEKERNRSELTPILLANTPLISIREESELKDRLVITFDGKEMKEPNIHTMLMQFVNTGNKPIDAHDFSGPIRIELDADSEVLTASVVKTEPEQFDAMAEPDLANPTKVLIQPVLLNLKQSISVKVLIRNTHEPKATIYAHIKGVKVLAIRTRYDEQKELRDKLEAQFGEAYEKLLTKRSIWFDSRYNIQWSIVVAIMGILAALLIRILLS